MNYCPVCGNTEPDYKCKCIEEATGIKPGAKPRQHRVVVQTKSRAQIEMEHAQAWAEIYETLICGQG